MKKTLLQFICMLVCGVWSTHAYAYWDRNPEPITSPDELKPGMFITLVNVNSEMASTKMLSTPGFTYGTYDNVMPKHVFELFDAGKNEWTGEQMYWLRSVETGKYLGSSNDWDAEQEDAIAITFAHGNVWAGVPDWGINFPGPDDDPVFPADKQPQWDWRNGDCLLFFQYLSENQVKGLGHVWGWDSYKTCSFNTYTLKPGERISSTTPWVAYEATQVDSPLDDLNELVNELVTANYTETRYLPGTTFGRIDTLIVAAYESALKAANDLLLDPASTDQQMRDAYKALLKAKNDLLTGVILPEDGHYYYIYLTDPRFEQNQGVKKAWYMDKNAVRWNSLDTDDISFLFKLEKQADGSFAIRSVMDNRYLSGATSVSETPTTTQSFFPSGHGNFYIINGIKPSTGGNDVYHADGHGDGKGITGPLKIWGQKGGLGTSDWNFMELTDLSRIDEMRKNYEQKVITEAFNEQLQQARTDSAAAYWTKNYIKRASQLSSNAVQQSEGSLANLLDGKYDTYFHSSWSTYIGEPHHLQIALDEPLQKFAVYFKKRHNNNNNRPVQMTILASNDGTSFNEVAVMPQAPDTLPTDANQIEYRSKAIDLGAPYKYIRFRVDTTNNGALEPAGPAKDSPRYPFFTFSEFMLSDEGFPVDPDCMGLREDMKPAYAALKAAIDEALAKDPKTVTQADVDALKAANEAFAKAYPDTTGLSSLIGLTNGYVETAFVVADGQEATMGMCTDQSKVDDMAAAATAARAALDANAKITRAEIDAQVTKLEAANEAFFRTVVMPEPNKWYFMESKCTSREDGTLGSIVYPASNAIGAQIKWGSSVNEGGTMNVKYLWRFVPVAGKEDVYAVQNMGTGYYMGEDRGLSTAFLLSDTIVEFKIAYVAGGELTLKANKEGSHMAHAQASGTVLVPWDSNKGSASAWTFVEASADEQVTEITLNNNSGDIICLPYDITGEFYGYNFDEGIDEAEVKAYTITDARYDEKGDITEIGVTAKEIGEEGITAGTPFLLIAGDINAETGVSLNIDLGLIFDSEISTVAKEDNGMIGLMATKTIEQTGIGYFSLTDGLQRSEKSIAISGQTGYIDGHKVKASGEAELYIPVKNGVITEIKQAVKDSKAIVNVYTVDGKLVRKNVKNADALKGLQKGLYVVNGKIYSVK